MGMRSDQPVDAGVVADPGLPQGHPIHAACASLHTPDPTSD